jgi:hypothetical protein
VPWLASGSSDMPKLSRLRSQKVVYVSDKHDCRTTHEIEHADTCRWVWSA